MTLICLVSSFPILYPLDLPLLVCIAVWLINWATSRENVSSGIFNQVRFKPACSATETARLLKLWTEQVYIPYYLSSEQQRCLSDCVDAQADLVLIRLFGCAGWSAPLLFAYAIKHIFAWLGPIVSGPKWSEDVQMSRGYNAKADRLFQSCTE